jgi:hypothetical protein
VTSSRHSGRGRLALADRGFFGIDLWREVAATGADLLWRVRKDFVLPLIEQLPDGSYLTEIFDQRPRARTHAAMARVVGNRR